MYLFINMLMKINKLPWIPTITDVFTVLLSIPPIIVLGFLQLPEMQASPNSLRHTEKDSLSFICTVKLCFGRKRKQPRVCYRPSEEQIQGDRSGCRLGRCRAQFELLVGKTFPLVEAGFGIGPSRRDEQDNADISSWDCWPPRVSDEPSLRSVSRNMSLWSPNQSKTL